MRKHSLIRGPAMKGRAEAEIQLPLSQRPSSFHQSMWGYFPCTGREYDLVSSVWILTSTQRFAMSSLSIWGPPEPWISRRKINNLLFTKEFPTPLLNTLLETFFPAAPKNHCSDPIVHTVLWCYKASVSEKAFSPITSNLSRTIEKECHLAVKKEVLF